MLLKSVSLNTLIRFECISDSTVSPRTDTFQCERISFLLHVDLVCLNSVWRINTPFFKPYLQVSEAVVKDIILPLLKLVNLKD